MTDKITVLVTGGGGYIGSHAVLALRDGGWPVVVLDDESNSTGVLVPADVPYVKGSIADRALVAATLRDHRIGAIMHFAGSILVAESVTDPLKYYRNNTQASLVLIEEVVAAGIPHFVFSSTAAIYGAPERLPIDEDDPKLPINPYGVSKWMTEQMLADAARPSASSKVHDFNYAALRYFNVAGADPQLRSGQIGRTSTHIVKIATEAALEKRPHVDVFGVDYPTPDGSCIRDYIHVSDLAAAHVAALEKLIERPSENLLLNCGYGTGLSVIEVLDALDTVVQRKVPRVIGPRRPGDPPQLVASNRALVETLDWTPAHADIHRIISDALAWERKLADGTPV
ncbi:UDP-glucose 4-epimerase GalE [Sphingomonas sp. RB1R13]|uniref:UDP-glucose 4-epimerase GalE n=1 Tax=Sphingomonas sp. RB1R13 TaxID=3096159 RepID=UPI002FC5E421